MGENQRVDIVKADEGWVVMHPIIEGDGSCKELFGEDIIAWGVVHIPLTSRDEPDIPKVVVTPITLEGACDLDVCLKNPFGKLCRPYIQDPCTMEEAIAYENESIESEKRRRLKTSEGGGE